MIIVYTKEANEDFVNITSYLLQFNDEDTVQKRVNKVKAEVTRLEQNSHIGTPVKSRFKTEASERYLVCGKYIVFYRLLKTEIEITRIADGRQNWQKSLF